MRLRLLSTCVLIPLLLSSLGCTKKEDPAVGSGSYTLDGRNITCQATASLESSQKVVEHLGIKLTTSPQPASGPETLVLYFVKAKGSANTTYMPTQLFYNGQQTNTIYNAVSATITETSSGVFAGTFSVITPPGSPIANGVFREVRL